MPEVDIAFPTEQQPAGSFRLLELPPDLCKLIESSSEGLNLAIKGGTDDDAVLCTSSKTYTVRSVVLSNCVLVVVPSDQDPNGNVEQVVIQDSLSEVLELIPAVPKLHRLNGLLRGHEWEEGQEEEESFGASKQKRITLEQAWSALQASEQELSGALKEKHILIIDGALRPLSSSYLHKILELLLMHLVSLSQTHEAASVVELCRSLEYDHEVNREVTLQVMRWFGELDAANESWNMDVEKVVRQVGLGVLRQHRRDQIAEHEFMAKWNTAIGDTFTSTACLSLLSGNYLCAASSLSSSTTMISYFPCAELPTDPAARFTDLFLTRPRWKADDIKPYLSEIAVDSKDLDKLLLKYARALTDKDGLWYTARAR
ncbi:sister chromatid cohesion protein Dcc1 [Gloeopeniophorella convolvens]|nr:sister chromatid cohesion protein Dcc1 [Gloeopeniophorella convolvens]